MNIIKKLELKHLSKEIIDDLFQNILGRAPSQEDFKAAVTDLSESLSVSHTLEVLLEAPENRAKVLRYFSEDIVAALYRVALKREPDPAGLKEHARQLSASGSIDETINGFINSVEFHQKHIQKHIVRMPFMNQSMPRIDNEYDKASPEQLKVISDKIKRSWEHLGQTRAHHSVLTNRDFLPESLEENIESFWNSGGGEVNVIEAILKRHQLSLNDVKTAVEYGCGVGRVTTPLSKCVCNMHAYDISQPHLNFAKQHAEEERASISFHLVKDPLRPLEKCDLFFSRIVFQHNPPPIIQQLIKNSLESLNPGGIAIFQVPTYIKGYSFRLQEWLESDHALDMQMHCIPQRGVFDLVDQANCTLLELREDDGCSEPDVYISNTFIIRKS